MADANVESLGNTYCFKDLTFTPKNVMVTPSETYRDVMVEMGAGGGGCHFRVVLSAANGFMVAIN